MVEPSADTAGWPDLAPSWPCGCPRSDALHEVTGADTADADAERVDTDAGHRTSTPGPWKADRGHRMRGYRSLDTGRADAGHPADTGHWTDGRWKRGCGQGGQAHGGHPDILGTTTPLGRRTVLLWAAHAALGEHDGLAVRPPASARDCLLRYPGSCSVAPPAAKRRPRRIALLGRFGSSVERHGGCHPVYGDAWAGAFVR
jgi:hypothetical protein